ncbi:Ubiquitin-conjugating enzyme [Nesidiocoris tenuis]|uniref:Ubiquitin-conjugating enzyme n=1 Tax=Nesidiocoris tenuis TaxID=355587 RepID=A0ABN7B3T0_9HEMI|nr:Ubiquitin-conjugating enzyme [Nesidiocoris tenuis]
MATEDRYFYEDEVFRINKKGYIEFGMVLQNSELVSSDDSETGGDPKIKKGHIRVAWHPTGAEEVVPERKVGLADRSLMPGDVVRRMIKGKDTQRGYCRHMEVTASIQIVGTRHIINGVNSKDLEPIEHLSPNLAVCLDSWVGGIRSVHSKLYLSLNNGITCTVSDPIASGFDVFDEKRKPDAEFPHRGDYYKGQVLYGPLSLLEEIAEWPDPKVKEKLKLGLGKSRANRNIEVCVDKVEIHSVNVRWQCRAYSKDGAGTEKEQPKAYVTGDDIERLKLLSVFEPCTLQVGDRHFYTIKPNDVIATREQWRREQKKLIMKSNQNSPVRVKSKRSNNVANVAQPADKSKAEVENGLLLTLPNRDCDGQSDNNEDASCDCNTSSDNESETASQASSTASGVSVSGGRRTPSLPVRTLSIALQRRKLKRTRVKKPSPFSNAEAGMRVVVETVSTSSTADVVWQDGSVQEGIPSTELYPIHHLDDQEFFPGDFVIENNEDACMRVYGVVQSVDHAGRTAAVKWFKTYASQDCPRPTLLMENEVSVYDLKDHPDFQYRPGIVVIRVANFQGEDEACTAGQVLDNYPEGRVKVWWVEGHVSMCWPQDLYKVGEYDTDGGDLWDDATSDDGSWQTESEFSNDENQEDVYNESLKPKLAANIEKARIAMSRLEEIFTQNPSLQTTEVMRKLLEVYKDCRYLDKLMGTMFFHESHFQGLLERVRERGRTNLAQRVADQVNRLFASNDNEADDKSTAGTTISYDDVSVSSDEKSQKRDSSGEFLRGTLASLEARVTSTGPKLNLNGVTSENGNVANNTSKYSEPMASQLVCVRLCTLILNQLVKAHTEVVRRFGGNTGSMAEVEAEANEMLQNKDSPNSPSASETAGNPSEPAVSPIMNGVRENGDGSSDKDRSESETTVAKESNVANLAEDSPLEASDTNLPSEKGIFDVIDTAPNSHKFKLTMFQPTATFSFYKRVKEEIKLLKSSLPPGTWVTTFEDRMDLFSVMIRGPEKTPYEDGLFFFDLQLSPDYPRTPPHCHYISYCSDRLNPNLYEEGKVCVSLLGTWSGKGTEVWIPTSNLLQIIVSIQGLILVAEPYFNEAGYEKQKGSQQGRENSRMYNEMVVLKMVQAMTKVIVNPPQVFVEEIAAHFRNHAQKMCSRLESWLDVSDEYNACNPLSPTTPTTGMQFLSQVKSVQEQKGVVLPEFPLLPASKGFCITLRKTLATFRQTIADYGHGLLKNHSS